MWGYLAVSFSTEDQFVNPLYDKENKELTNAILRPKIVPQNIKFWRELYCRFERGAHPREPLIDLLAITQNHTTSLEDHGRQLTKTINYYTQKINVAKSATGMLKSMSLNSPAAAGLGSGVAGTNAAAASSLNSKGHHNSSMSSNDSNNSNVSVGGASSTNDSILVSPKQAGLLLEDSNDQQLFSGCKVSPSLSLGEEALLNDALVSSKSPKRSPVNSKRDNNAQKVKMSQNTFCDPLLRRESESESSVGASGVPNIKDMNISKVVEKCQSST